MVFDSITKSFSGRFPQIKTKYFTLINYLKIILTSSKAGGVAFFGVIGFRAPSFPDLSTGETAARPLVLAGGNAEGAKDPPWISPKKRPALKSQTKKNATPPGEYYYETINNSGKRTLYLFRKIQEVRRGGDGNFSFPVSIKID
ncbi:MAG: hypothetical protein HY787_19140 [Deltaproteobacteria bacterium]|nr:hypothetical protein [Deltaproteobacteria bacterium]